MYESLNLSDLMTVVLGMTAVVIGATVWLCRTVARWATQALGSAQTGLHRLWQHRRVIRRPASTPAAPAAEPQAITRMVSAMEGARDWSSYTTPSYIRRGRVICT